jgi:hypothetical protein
MVSLGSLSTHHSSLITLLFSLFSFHSSLFTPHCSTACHYRGRVSLPLRAFLQKPNR